MEVTFEVTCSLLRVHSSSPSNLVVLIDVNTVPEALSQEFPTYYTFYSFFSEKKLNNAYINIINTIYQN